MNKQDYSYDQQLFVRIVKGEEAAFHELYDGLATYVLKLCYSLLQNQQLAEEAVQDIFLKVWRKASDWRPDASAKTWILKIARNHCLDIIRKNKSEKMKLEKMAIYSAADQDNSFFNNAETKIDEAKYQEKIKIMLFSIPERQREAITYVYYMGIQNHEAAKIMGVEQIAFDSLLARARRNMRKALQNGQEILKGYDINGK
jgi:RNA polymerase sigma-70 factor (ECF subfamily)